MEIYVMPAFNKLKVKDIDRVSRWYQSRLGFASLFQYKNGVDEVIMEHIRGNKYQDIMLVQSNNFEVGNGVIMNFTVADIEEIVKRCCEDEIVEPIRVQPWNATELTIRDSEGYLITLTQTEGKTSESFDSVIDNVHSEYD